jgi:hypothetical protein
MIGQFVFYKVINIVSACIKLQLLYNIYMLYIILKQIIVVCLKIVLLNFKLCSFKLLSEMTDILCQLPI